jgi:UDP-N-acetylmuramoyl-tripeptide--D-alanyl-D-alanine ligase
MASAFLFIEGMISLISILSGRIKRPVMTSKALFLILPVFFPFLVLIFFLFNDLFNAASQTLSIGISDVLFYLFLVLLFDVFTPLINSLIVLLFQPITVLMRNRTLYKASFKIETLTNLLVIGITGSFGKSSTKEFLNIILSECFNVVTTEKNQNSEIGISECILNNVNDNHEIFICEMGAYNKGGIKLLASIAKPKIGILTGIGNQHMSTFGSKQNIVDTKFELIDSLPDEGLAVLNWDSEEIRKNFMGKVANIKVAIG